MLLFVAKWTGVGVNDLREHFQLFLIGDLEHSLMHFGIIVIIERVQHYGRCDCSPRTTIDRWPVEVYFGEEHTNLPTGTKNVRPSLLYGAWFTLPDYFHSLLKLCYMSCISRPSAVGNCVRACLTSTSEYVRRRAHSAVKEER